MLAHGRRQAPAAERAGDRLVVPKLDGSAARCPPRARSRTSSSAAAPASSSKLAGSTGKQLVGCAYCRGLVALWGRRMVFAAGAEQDPGELVAFGEQLVESCV